MNCAIRRAEARAARLAARPGRRPKADPMRALAATQPWKVNAVFAPLDNIFAQLQQDGTVHTERGVPVYWDTKSNQWHEIEPALGGLIDYYEIATRRHQVNIDLQPLTTFCNRLGAGTPLTLENVAAAQATTNLLRQFALHHLTIGEANDILTSAKIKFEIEEREAA